MSAYAVSARGLVSRRIPQGVLAPMNALLFGSGQQGAWYDPSDLGTLFQDAAGTTPVTAMEQPVGRMLDLSGNGNHASQATTTKRGVVSRRVNLLTNSEAVDLWFSLSCTVDANVALSPTGSLTADRVNFSASASSGVYQNCITAGAAHTFSVFAKTDSVSKTFRMFPYNAVDSSESSPNFTPTADWQRFAFNFNRTQSTSSWNIYTASPYTTGAVLFWGASLVFSSLAHLPYQWVNTATDYDDNAFKFPTYLKSDGIDDSYSSATGGGGNAGFFFSEAITVLGGAGTNRVRFSDAGANTGYIVRINASNQLELAAGNGTAFTTIATAGTLAVGSTDIIQAWDDGVTLNVKIGTGATASIARPAVSAGTAGYTMGQDTGASTGYFNGRVYSTVYRKDSSPTQSQREAVAVLQRLKARMP